MGWYDGMDGKKDWCKADIIKEGYGLIGEDKG